MRAGHERMRLTVRWPVSAEASDDAVLSDKLLVVLEAMATGTLILFALLVLPRMHRDVRRSG